VADKPANFLKIFFFAFFIGTYLYFLGFYLTRSSPSFAPATSNFAQITDTVATSTEKVSRIIDGDTLEIEGGVKVRLIGIDTPEMKNKNKTIDCFAAEAKKKAEGLLMNKDVVLEKDVSETDRYGRLLRYVYLDGEMINDKLVKEGYAKMATFPPDVKNAKVFLASEKFARENQSGLWQACK